MYKTYTGNEGQRNDSGVLLYGLIIENVLLQQNITCGNTPTLAPAVPLKDRKTLKIFNNSGNIIYYGASNVSATNGMPIYPHAWEILQIEDGINVYIISAGGGEDCRLAEGN